MTIIPAGDLTEAAALVAQALAGAIPHSLLEARLAQAELLSARKDPGAHRIITRSLEVARREGHLTSARRLEQLLG